jgi:hypothetical protein
MPRSLDVNLLAARDRLGQTVLEVVSADFAVHGEEVIIALRQKNPACYSRLLADLLQFKKLATGRTPRRRPPRPLRMKALLETMGKTPSGGMFGTSPGGTLRVPPGIDPNSLTVRLLEAELQLRPRRPEDLSDAELDATFGPELATHWRKIRVRQPTPASTG